MHVNLAGLCPEKLKRLKRGGDVRPLAVTADITSELAAELQAPRWAAVAGRAIRAPMSF